MNSKPSKAANSNKVFLVLAIIAGSMLVICCGFAGLTAVAVRSYTHPADIVELPAREVNNADDSEAFCESISQLSSETAKQSGKLKLSNVEKNDPQVDDFVKTILNKIDRDEKVPFNMDMFIEAIDASHYYRGSMSIVERLTLATWLREYAPVPDSTDDYHRVIGFHRTGDRLAELDILFYSENNQPMSVRWFLVNQNIPEPNQPLDLDQWQIYDHARLEDGRRKSDEYANYLKGDEQVSDGYDDAINDAYAISLDWDWEQPEQSVAKLRKCESARMLADDRDIALLHFSYIYLENNAEAEAIRVLKKIQKPEQMWGVWPMMALCYSNSERFDKATEYLTKAQQQVPGHPRNQWLGAVVDSAMNREDEAADQNTAALTMMPQDTSLYSAVASKHRIKDIPLLVSAADFSWKQRRLMNGWLTLADAARTDSKFAKKTVLTIQNVKDVPTGIEMMVAGSAAWADGYTETAAKSFLVAGKEAEHDDIKLAAREKHQQCRLIDKNFVALFSETDDIDATLLAVLGWAYDEELGDAASQLVTELKSSEDLINQRLANHPITSVIRGWAHLQLGQHEVALRNLDQFHHQLESSPHPELSDDAEWVTDFVDTMVTQCLLNLDRANEVVTRFENEPWRLDQISQWFINRRDTKNAMKFLKQHENDSRDLMRLQALKLKAFLAASSNNVKESSKNHHLAIFLGERIEKNQENYWTDDLLRNYTRDMVVMKAMPTNVNSTNLRLYQQLISQAEATEDGPMVHNWFDQAMKSPEIDDSIRLRIAKSLGDYHLSQGEYQEAIDAFTAQTESSSKSEANLRYLKKSLHDARILSLLATNQIDAARNALEEQDESVGYSSVDLPPLAIADLAAWDVGSLRKNFTGIKSSEAANWLVEAPRRKFFEQKSNDPLFDELLDAYPMPIGYHQPQQFGRLVFSSQQNPSVEKEIIKTACTDALGTPASVEAASTVEPGTSWIVSTDAGDRVLIATGQMALSPATIGFLNIFPSDQQQHADAKHSMPIMMVAILDYSPYANKRIFDISQRLASLPSLNQATNRIIAFSHGSHVWTAPNDIDLEDNTMSLANQLRWKQRMPVNFQTFDYYLSSDFDFDQTKAKSSSQWNDVLNTSTASPEMFVMHTCGDVREQLSAELLAVDQQTNQATVRLKESSAISNYLRAGKTCTCQAKNLRLENP